MIMLPYGVEHSGSFLNFMTINIGIAFKLHRINTNLHSKYNSSFCSITPLVNKVLIAILVPTSSYSIKFLSQTKMARTANNIKKKQLYARLFFHFSYRSPYSQKKKKKKLPFSFEQSKASVL